MIKSPSRRILVLLLGLHFAGCAATRKAPVSDETVAFTHVNVVPMDREVVLEDYTVVVQGDRIAELGPTRAVSIPSGATIIHAQGKYLMPGLADMHAHLEEEEDALLLFVANGVTTVRNMWGKPNHLEWRKEIAGGERLGPTIYTTGPITDGDPPMWQGSAIIATPDDAERDLAAQKNAGYDAMKIMTNLRPEVYEVVLAASKKHQFPVYGHVPTRVGYRKALGSGQRSFEHMLDFVYGLLPEDSPLWPKIIAAWEGTQSVDHLRAMWTDAHVAVKDEDPSALARMASSSGAWFCPTLVASDGFFIDRAGFDALHRLPYNEYVPKTRRLAWDASLEWQLTNFSSPDNDKVARGVQRRAVQALQRAGAKLVTGTDTHPEMPYIIPGFSLHEELHNLVGVGLSPYQALKASTAEPAGMLGRSEEFGTVAVGRRADLILLEGNPLEDVSNAARRVGVMLRGQWLSDDLLQMKLDALAETIRTEDVSTQPQVGNDCSHNNRLQGTIRYAARRCTGALGCTTGK